MLSENGTRRTQSITKYTTLCSLWFVVFLVLRYLICKLSKVNFENANPILNIIFILY